MAHISQPGQQQAFVAVTVTFAPRADVATHVDNKGACSVVIELSRGGNVSDRKTVRTPHVGSASSQGDLEGDAVDTVTISCGARQQDGDTCEFDYTVSQR